MKYWLYVPIAVGLVLFGAERSLAGDATQTIGGGAHYWVAVDDIDIDDIDEDGLAWFVSYQVRPAALLTLEADLEFLPDDFAGADDTVLAPQAYVLVGSVIYAGAGIGIYYADDEFADEPFYVLRAGLNLELLPELHLDVSGNYRFTEWDDTITDDIDTDTVTIAAAARLGF